MSSSEATGGNESEPIQTQLEGVYRQYQQAHLYEAMDDIAGEMERQLLQKRIANTLLGTELEISPDTRNSVETAQQKLGTDDLDALEQQIEATKKEVESERSEINKRIQESRVELHNTVEAITKLNKEIGFTNSEELDYLEELLDSWAWESEIEWDGTNSTEGRLGNAEEFARRMRETFEEASNAIGEEFEGSEVQTLVTSLLTGGGISLTELDPDQREALAESELADHIELSLG